MPRGAVHVLRDSRGRFLLRSGSFDDILLFDSTGTFVRTASGTSSPGFAAIGNLALGRDDDIWAYDYRAGRVVVLDRNLAVANVFFSSYGPTIVREDGSWIVNLQIQDAALIGFPLHLTDPAGAVLRSFGTDVPQYRSDIRLLTTRLVAPASDDTVWSIAPGRYVIDRWDPESGERLQRLELTSSWFQESPRHVVDERTRPNTVVESLWEQGGLLWVLTRRADLQWTPPRRANDERPHDAEEYERTYDWMLEAIDPSQGQLLASRRFREPLWSRSGFVLASLMPSDAAESPGGVQLWRARLQ